MTVSRLGTAVGYAYRIAAALLIVGAYFFVHWSRTHSQRPWSALAVAAGALGILHPTIWVGILMAANIPCYELPWFGRGDDEILSFSYSAMVLSLAIVAIVRIARSKGKLRGIPFCIAGFIAGGFVFFNWIWLLFTWINATVETERRSLPPRVPISRIMAGTIPAHLR